MHPTLRFSLSAVVAVTAASTVFAGPATASPIEASACGTPLSSSEIANIAALSDMDTLEPGTDLEQLEEVVERNHQISQALIRHQDRRGVFIVGFDTAEQVAVMPIQRDESLLVNPVYARKLSLVFLRDFLTNVHGEFTGGPVEYQWKRYFDLAKDCSSNGVHLAMTGYLSHVVVDLTHASQLAGAQPADAPDLMRLIDNIAIHFDDLVDATEQAYGVDMRPVWHFWAFGDLANSVAGPHATTQVRRTAFLSDAGIVAESIALQNPALRDVTEAALYAQWIAGDAVLSTAAQLHAL